MKPLPPCDVIILAAGQGRRLRSNAPKALAPLAEKPLLAHVLTAVQAMRPRRVVVVVTPHAAEVRTVARAVCPAAKVCRPANTARYGRCRRRRLGDAGK